MSDGAPPSRPSEDVVARPVGSGSPPSPGGDSGVLGEKPSPISPALAISLVALLISILAFYFQNLRINEDIQVVFANHRYSRQGMVAFDMVFANGGNRTAVVTDFVVKVFGGQCFDLTEHPQSGASSTPNSREELLPLLALRLDAAEGDV